MTLTNLIYTLTTTIWLIKISPKFNLDSMVLKLSLDLTWNEADFAKYKFL
jgi:hypothetical protein